MPGTRFRQRSSTVRTILRLCASWIAIVTLAQGSAYAQVVPTWNAVVDTVSVRFGGPQQQARIQAMAQIAVHDALNSIDARYARYAATGPLHPGASPDAAVAAAARRTLLNLLAPLPDSPPKQAAVDLVESTFQSTVGPQPYSASTQDGIDAGESAGLAILARRVADGSDTPNLPYTLPPGPGVYQPTPNPEFPAVITPANAGWAYVTPFVLRHGRQFGVDPGALFDLTGEAYAANYNEVKSVGDARVRGLLPDSAESDIARFWPGGGSNWNLTARLLVANLNLDAWQLARLFAHLDMAQADALIANQTWKYTYVFWRPVTAIRWADDGNPDTQSDPSWRPFLVTPPYPDYPCALPSATAASAEVLREYLGTDSVAFTRTFAAPPVPLPTPLAPLPGKTITRSFASLGAAVAESIEARIFGGLHFREGCAAGAKQGEQVGRFVTRHSLEPVKGSKH